MSNRVCRSRLVEASLDIIPIYNPPFVAGWSEEAIVVNYAANSSQAQEQALVRVWAEAQRFVTPPEVPFMLKKI